MLASIVLTEAQARELNNLGLMLMIVTIGPIILVPILIWMSNLIHNRKRK